MEGDVQVKLGQTISFYVIFIGKVIKNDVVNNIIIIFTFKIIHYIFTLFRIKFCFNVASFQTVGPLEN